MLSILADVSIDVTSLSVYLQMLAVKVLRSISFSSGSTLLPNYCEMIPSLMADKSVPILSGTSWEIIPLSQNIRENR